MVKAWAEQFNTKLKPITKAQKLYHQKISTKYLFITPENKENGDYTCPKCGKKHHLGKTKHKSEVVCPSCTNKLIVQHTWRMSQYLETIRWMVVPTTVNDHVLCLRYVLAYQDRDKPMVVREAAREYIDEYHVEPELYCNYGNGNGWERGRGTYFRTDSYIMPNRFWCRPAYEYPVNFFEEIDKLDCFKYYSSKIEYQQDSWVSQLGYMIHAARINEKLYKIGMKDIVTEHRYYFCTHGDRVMQLNYKEKSLKKIIGLDQLRFNFLMRYPSFGLWQWLKNNADVNLEWLDEAKGNTSQYTKAVDMVNKIHVSFSKANKYIAEVLGEDKYYDYKHYLSNLEHLGYDIKDTYYSLPKDFEAADMRVTDEYMMKFEKERFEKRKKNDGLIKKISDGLRNMPDLKEFLDGSKGLLIYVPESVQDLTTEGRAMHNCIGTYVDRIAEGKTLVFFVRKLDNPTAPFVAFEYCDGKVIQCRYDHNKNVNDTQILDFVNRFADALRKSA